MHIYRFNHPISDARRSDILFQGDLIVFRELPALLELNRYLDELIREQTNVKPVPGSYGEQSEQQFNLDQARIQKAFNRSEKPGKCFQRALEQAGVEPEQNYSDRLFLRAVPPQRLSNNLFRGAIGYHRDTWGSNIQNQINWWAPLYPVTEENSIAFYPVYWNKAVANTSDSWSFQSFLEAREKSTERAGESANESVGISYPYAPEIHEPIDERGRSIVIIEPGDLLCFSSAHLHASVPNTSEEIRYSAELRTFNIDDILHQRMPANVDNAGAEPHYEWFRRLSDRQSLRR